MSIQGIFNTSKQGLLVHQRAISVTSNNIANVNTPGYTRQRPVFSPVSPTLMADGFGIGGGVELSQVRRVVDEALDAQLRQERQEFSRDSYLEAGLTRIDAIFDELGGTGFSATMAEFFGALNDLADDPSNTTTRTDVVQQAQTLVTQIHDANYRMSGFQVELNEQLKRNVGEVNLIAQDLAEVNSRIFSAESLGADANILRDRRGELLDQLGQKIDYTSFERPDGTISVFVGGGFLLVDGMDAGSLVAQTTQPTALNQPYYVNIYQSISGSLAGPITSGIRGGEMGAALDLRDTRTQLYRDRLDELAYTLANRINTVHLAGRGLDDASARNFFIDPNLGGANPPGDPIADVRGAAAEIEVNAAIVANPRHLAAGVASTNATPSGSALAGDNTNALALAAVETQGAAFFLVADGSGPATGASQSLGSFLDTLTGTIGSELQSTRRALDQQELMIAHLEDRRGAISGVSIDEEVTNLVAFERAYQASARVFSVVDELLQNLLAM